MPAPDFQRSLRAAEAHLARVDRQLGRVIARVGPCQLETPQKFDPFHALVRSICHQQLHGKAAETIFGRVVAAYGTLEGQADVKRLNAARLPGLRACGLSESKALAIKDLAKKRLDGTVPDWRTLSKLPNEAIIERITEVRGIGPWTVEMMLMFRLGRLDVLPVDDFGVRKGFTLLRKLEEPITAKALMPHGEPWRPYRTVASWYLWRVADGQ